jgi:XTP/dITP diphosphohydrolase
MSSFDKLIDILVELRHKCPWDREQTMDTLRTLTIEETYELSEAILAADMPNIRKELGDLLLHIVFYAQIAREQGAFNINDVIESLCSKLIYRHPHVFGDAKAADAGEVVQRWEQIKLTEKNGNHTALGGVPAGLPAVIKAYRIQDKARAVGFDWERREDVWAKVKEEIAELEAELRAFADKSDSEQAQKMEDELGDVMFSLINAARLYGIDPETALERTNKKFICRFNNIEQQAKAQGRNIKSLSLSEMEQLWQASKCMS